ncbi:MAG: S8 family serine peptidase [Acidobacteria bacterium]|nr:S8 family serine peptidase [Acidobacteriota bacterium]
MSIYRLGILLLLIFLIVFAVTGTNRGSAKQSQNNDDPSGSIRRSKELAALRQALEASQGDSRFLLTRTAVFDPLEKEPNAVRVGTAELNVVNLQAKTQSLKQRAAVRQTEAQPTDVRGYFIVQYSRAIPSAKADSLRARGLEIAGYLPNNAYIVKATAAQAEQLQATNEARWIGAYGAGLKIEPELAAVANESNAKTESVSDPIDISFLTFRNETAGALREVLNQSQFAGEAVIEERNDDRVWGVVSVLPNQLPTLLTALANVESIEWIEQRRAHQLHNDNLVRAVQTGYISSDTPLYRNGLTGAGQVYGTADSGLDTDHSQFRLSGDAAAQTLSYATTTASLTNGLLPFKITNQNNKVLTYYLLGSSGFLAQKDNPNGGQTLDPTRQSGTRFLNAASYDDSAKGYHGTLTTSVAVGRNYGANGSGAVPGIATRSSGDGIAPDAKVVFQDVGHTNGQLPGVDSVSQAQIHQQAYSSGVRVHNNSYGPAPPAVYDQDAADVDEMMWRLRDYTVFFSAGNNSAGDYQVTNAAKNNIVVGATDSPTGKGNLENLSRTSNHGPTFDGRIKPDIVAPSTVIGATESTTDQKASSYTNYTSVTAKDASVNASDPNNNSTLLETAVSGTSFASAAAAGGALLVRQYFTDGFYPSGTKGTGASFNPSNALMKAVLLNSGRNLSGRFTASNSPISTSGPLPNNGQGWGCVVLDDALFFAGDRRELKVLADIWNGAVASESGRPAPNAAITTGQTHAYQLANVSNVEPLRITLVWADPRAAVGSIVALVNNLNLEVIAPDGTVYRGNVNFQNAWSQAANGANFDSRNPVEAVYIQYPIPGTYTVRVIGENVPGNGQTNITAQPNDQKIDSNRQGYALIATGNFTAGAQPVLNLAATNINGGVNADAFISKNETVNANVTINNPSTLAAQNVSVKVEVDSSSEVPASSIQINGQAAGTAATINVGDVAASAAKNAIIPLTLLDDGESRVGQLILFKVTMTPTNGVPFTTQFSTRAQLKLITYRTRFESSPDPGGAGVIVISESEWKKRTDHNTRASSKDVFDSDWKLTTATFANANGSTASLSDPSNSGQSYSVGSISRDDGQVYDDTRWWTPKIALPGLFVNEATGLLANPENAADLKAEIDSFDVDIKADFIGDVTQSSSSGDFLILRARTYDNSVSVRSITDSGATEARFTNLLYLDARNVTSNGFVHYSGNNFASGDGVFFYDEDEDDAETSDVFFRLELQFRRNGFPQTGDGVFIDNLVVRLRVADTAVYAASTAGSVTTVDAASYTRMIAPGQIVSAFGTGFPARTNLTASVSTLPLPTKLENVTVRVNGVNAPLFFLGVNNGAYQINYQLPFETATGTAQIEVLNDGKLIATEYLKVSSIAPAVFTFDASGQGQAAVLNQDYSRNGATNPEARGRYVIVYATGQGAQLLDETSRQLLRLPSGFAAPIAPLYVTAEAPAVTVGGVPAQVAFSGLAPGFVGLWQLNVLIPANAPTGAAVPLVITMSGNTSRTTTIAVN